MANITLEKLHDLLEKLAEYVMTELPTRKEMDAKLAQKADKKDLEILGKKVDNIIDILDAQSKRLDTIQQELESISRTLDIHENRLGDLEQRTLGYRVREEEK